jgi:PAS domain S-box-containing protein
MISDLNANVEYVNQAFVNSSGYCREDIIGKNTGLFKSGKTPQTTYETMWSALHDGKTWHGELINKNKRGEDSIQRTWITPIRQDNQIVSHYLSVTEDVTERKKTEATLIKLSMALEQSLSSVMITDLDANIEYVNQAFVNSTGYSREEIIGQKPSLLKSGKTSKATYDEMWAALLAGKAWEAEVTNLNKQGEEFIELTWLSPIRQSNGIITHYLGVKEDITQRKKNEALLLAAKERAENLSKTKSQFLANMSHEIRTPMTAIIGFSDLALLNEEPEETYQYLQNISTASKHLLTILNDILDVSKLEAGQMRLQLERFKLDDLRTTLYGLLVNTAQKKGLSLTIDIGGKVPDTFIGDSLRLRQVLINLLGNAIKFTQQGSVTLTISLQQLNVTEARLLFAVTDTGMGISAQQQDKLFQPFSQVDDGFSRNFEGTGLGLVISQDLVQLMGGSIKLDSHVGLGSCFSFELVLPLALSTIEPQVTSPITLNTEPLSGVRILVVEDDAFNQKVINKMLNRFGASIVLANNGLEALAALEQDSFDVVLMDLFMPSMNGYETALEIRKQTRYAKLPVISISASVTEEDKHHSLAAGMNDFIAKPINKIELLATLERWLKP